VYFIVYALGRWIRENQLSRSFRTRKHASKENNYGEERNTEATKEERHTSGESYTAAYIEEHPSTRNPSTRRNSN